VVIFSNCKINLGLHILSKRENGFHNLETFFYPIPFYDVIEIIPAEKFLFTSTGLPISGTVEDNLCVKAYNLLKQDYPNLPNVHIHLQKNIPMGAGIGGGSANAAYTLLLLNNKFQLNVPNATLLLYAAKLGSDCSFFINNNPGFEIDENTLNNTNTKIFIPYALDLTNYTIVLLFPKIHINTKEAFSNVTPKKPANSIKEAIYSNIENWKTIVLNVFEETIFPQYPVLKTYKEKLYELGATYASMSGSGSTIYGIFEKEKNIATIIDKEFATIAFKII
jgi:4-diphosphocytidyl-2-C-methyl-D-erythritol kinase